MADSQDKKTNAVNPAYTWQNNQAAVGTDNGKLRKFGMIALGLVLFFGLAVLLAFI